MEHQSIMPLETIVFSDWGHAKTKVQSSLDRMQVPLLGSPRVAVVRWFLPFEFMHIVRTFKMIKATFQNINSQNVQFSCGLRVLPASQFVRTYVWVVSDSND